MVKGKKLTDKASDLGVESSYYAFFALDLLGNLIVQGIFSIVKPLAKILGGSSVCLNLFASFFTELQLSR
jgi:hypothetical protein